MWVHVTWVYRAQDSDFKYRLIHNKKINNKNISENSRWRPYDVIYSKTVYDLNTAYGPLHSYKIWSQYIQNCGRSRLYQFFTNQSINQSNWFRSQPKCNMHNFIWGHIYCENFMKIGAAVLVEVPITKFREKKKKKKKLGKNNRL